MERIPPFMARAARGVVEHTPLNYSIEGKQYIDEAREILGEGGIVIAALDHRGFADMVSGACVAIKEDFDDLVQVADIIIKISYIKTFPTNLLPKYFRVSPVVPHTMPDYPNRDEINRQAIERAQNLPDGSLLVVTPEGTRSGQVGIQEARYGAQQFWHGRGKRYIIPLAVEGTEKQWPRKLGMPVGGVYYNFYGRFKNAKFIFGEPRSVESYDSIAERLGKNEDDIARLRTEVVMADIARLHLEKGKAEYAGRYADLARELQKIRP
jgi:hypothetical protein